MEIPVTESLIQCQGVGESLRVWAVVAEGP
jgi:hypothetical protein